MKKISTIVLLGMTLSLGLEVLAPQASYAQLFYPPASDRHSVMVIGQGVVKVPADNADIELLIDNTSQEDEPDLSPPSADEQSVSATRLLFQQKTPAKLVQSQTGKLTTDSLKPLVDSIIKQGVNPDQVRVQISEDTTENKAKIFVRLEKPTSQSVNQIITAAKKAAAKLDNISVSKAGVEYSVNDCLALQNSVYQAAAQDAQNRAQALAAAMGVKLGKPSVSEPFYTLLYSSCNTKAPTLPSFASFLLSSDYDPNKPAEVEMRKDIFVTFTVR
ncbi:MAG TPA: SIMPL domain-containing protein [Nostocaceae cyanobacterium]|nr:SIMPL domain-containing protein [Nostocaceae cyanobacterium]